ncbi:MAG: hypothetical protein O3C63_02440 [Cyanobacteria bacterium]|nr:hypothetical protein [Cyanobacteriota bacterium]
MNRINQFRFHPLFQHEIDSHQNPVTISSIVEVHNQGPRKLRINYQESGKLNILEIFFTSNSIKGKKYPEAQLENIKINGKDAELKALSDVAKTEIYIALKPERDSKEAKKLAGTQLDDPVIRDLATTYFAKTTRVHQQMSDNSSQLAKSLASRARLLTSI